MSVNAVQAHLQIFELCNENHATQDCLVGNTFCQHEQVNYINNHFQYGLANSYGNQCRSIQPKLEKHESKSNMDQSDNNVQCLPQQYNALEKKINVEGMFGK